MLTYSSSWYGTWLVLLVHQLANEFDLCNGRKALTSCQKQLHPVASNDDISVMLGGRLLPTRIQVQVNRASVSPLTSSTSDMWKNSPSASDFVLQPAIPTRRGIITFLSHDSRVNGQWSQGIRSELILRLADDLASLDAQN